MNQEKVKSTELSPRPNEASDVNPGLQQSGQWPVKGQERKIRFKKGSLFVIQFLSQFLKGLQIPKVPFLN